MKTKLGKIALVMSLLLLAALPAAAVDLAALDQMIGTKQVPKIEAVIAELTQHLEEQPNDSHALWLIGKAHLYLGERITDDVLATFEKGKEYADRAVEIAPDSPDAHFWQAALIGRIGQTRGILQSLFMVRPMKDALDRVLELDENYAGAYDVLSQLYEEAPGFPLSIGNKKLALEMAQKAVELGPDNIEYPIQLARALDHNGRRGEAVEVLRELLARPEVRLDPEIEAAAQELLAKLDR